MYIIGKLTRSVFFVFRISHFLLVAFNKSDKDKSSWINQILINDKSDVEFDRTVFFKKVNFLVQVLLGSICSNNVCFHSHTRGLKLRFRLKQQNSR